METEIDKVIAWENIKATQRIMEVNAELLAACEAALSEYHPSARDGDPIAEQLMRAIAKATDK